MLMVLALAMPFENFIIPVEKCGLRAEMIGRLSKNEGNGIKWDL